MMNNLPEKFTIPEDRIPKPWAQNQSPTIRVGSCVACTFTKILEVINYVKTGVYVYMSKGYMYVRNNHPDKNKPGMYEEYTLNMLLKRGSVPEEMCKDYGELPEIREIIEKREDIAELDRVAEQYAIKAWEEIPGNAQRFQKIKEYLYKYQMPLAGYMPKYQGEPHFAVICGWDGDSIIWQNHDKEGKLKKTKQGNFTRAFYLEGDLKMRKFKDVSDERWSKNYIDKVCQEGVMNGVLKDEFAPEEPVTREQLAAVLCRALYGME